jgi:hydroxymethylpyrimidine/phosphomethylpyrimidine kinase
VSFFFSIGQVEALMNPVALVISGFDPANHAGYGGDVRVMTALGVHPVGVITALTAQIPGRFEAAWGVDSKKIAQQLNLLFSYYSIRAIKIGMIQSIEICKILAPFLQKFSGPIVVDPLRHASAGPAPVLLNKNAHTFFKNEILGHATLVTPNHPEMEWLLDEKQTMLPKDLCLKFLEQFKVPVLLKGGHGKDKKIVEDIFFDGKKIKRWKRTRLNTLITHGTGCFLSSAIAAYLAKGLELIPAIDAAQKKLSLALKYPSKIDKNNYLSYF